MEEAQIMPLQKPPDHAVPTPLDPEKEPATPPKQSEEKDEEPKDTLKLPPKDGITPSA